MFVESTPTVSATPIPDKPDVKDLFSAHDFDIQIDLPSSPRGKQLAELSKGMLWCAIILEIGQLELQFLFKTFIQVNLK